MVKLFSLLMIVTGLLIGPAYWFYTVLYTGGSTQSLPMRADEKGVYRSPVFRLTPDQGPVGLALQAQGSLAPNSRDEEPLRDRYAATLYQNGNKAQPLTFTLSAGSDPSPTFKERLLFLNVPRTADYRLELAPITVPNITLGSVQLEIRHKVRQPDTRVVMAGILLLTVGLLILVI